MEEAFNVLIVDVAFALGAERDCDSGFARKLDIVGDAGACDCVSVAWVVELGRWGAWVGVPGRWGGIRGENNFTVDNHLYNWFSGVEKSHHDLVNTLAIS